MEEIMSETPVTMAKLNEELEKIKKRDKELNFRAAKTEEYLGQFVKAKKADGLVEKINQLNIPRLREQQITKIIDVLPATVKDLKMILQGYTMTVSNENLKKIVDVINDFIAK